MDTISTGGISVQFDPDGGRIESAAITRDEHEIRPLHKAPWVDTGEVLPDNLAKSERKLAGDFFCAPFGRSAPDVPIHGWSANGTWDAMETEKTPAGTVTARYALREPISGAKLTKSITLIADHAIVYQTHVFDGGTGHIPVAHHAMVRAPGGARLSFSPKAFGRTMPAPLEEDPARGRSILAYPQEFSALSEVRRADGGTVDARTYPFDNGHEDLIVLSEKPGNRIGWSAAVAQQDGFLFFALKDASVLPQTILWMSNGGRSYAPWSSRHTAVLGIEEAAAGIHLTPDEAADRARSPDGLPITLALGGRSAVRYVFGAIAVPQGWSEVADITIVEDSIRLLDRGGGAMNLPFLGSFFDGNG